MAITGYTDYGYYGEPQKTSPKRKYVREQYNYVNDIYISISNSDNFHGLIIPKEFENIIETVVNHDQNYDIIDFVFDNYEEYRDYEVECSHQARHGSVGSEKLNNLDEILEFFEDMGDKRLNKKLAKFKKT